MKGKVIIVLGAVALATVVTLLSLVGLAGAGPLTRPNLQAGSPTVVSYQGQVKVGGSAYDGTGYFKFAVVNAAGDTTYWSNDDTSSGGSEPTNAVSLDVDNSLFNVLLGDTSLTNMTEALTASVFSGTDRHLRVWFSSDGTTFTLLSPDRRIAAVPYALQAEEAKNANTLDTLDSSAFWQLGGNSGTTPGTHFLGTTDEVSLTLAVSNTAALRLEPASDYDDEGFSPNVIGGYSGNSVTAGKLGATISGGGFSSSYYSGDTTNRVIGDLGTVGGGYGNVSGYAGTVAGGQSNEASGLSYATVGGGQSNIASDTRATVGGGGSNEASAGGATVGGGENNAASGNFATVAGGQANTASSLSSYATVGGGQSNTASGQYATVGGGDTNIASATRATVGGGGSNEASSGQATVGGGLSNTASGNYATVAGGQANTASATHATVPGGSQAKASLYGQMAYASGPFAAAGDAQASLYVLRNETSGDTPTSLYLDGGNNPHRLTVASGRTMTFDILVVARSTGGDSAGYRAEGVIENDSGTTSLIGTPTVTELGEDSDWTVAVQADDGNDALVINVTGAASTNIRWVATVRTAEVAY